jgi:MarR family transcriptional regulator, organic hydroperoxide resistance regulator
MKDFSMDAFQLLSALISINEKYNQIEKNPRVFGDGIKVYPSQIRTIVMIGHHAGINLTELSQHLEITKASASELITKLVENGLVHKTRDAGNSKEVILHITDKCREILEDVDRRHEKMFQDIKSILDELHENDYELVIRVLKKVEFYLDEFIKEST